MGRTFHVALLCPIGPTPASHSRQSTELYPDITTTVSRCARLKSQQTLLAHTVFFIAALAECEHLRSVPL